MGCKATIGDTTGMQLFGRKRTSFLYKRKQEAKAVLEEGPGATQKLMLEQMSEQSRREVLTPPATGQQVTWTG